MNKNIKSICVFLSVLLLLIVSIVTANAETIYQLDGYSYKMINNRSVALCGWDNRSTDLVVPRTIVDREVTEISAFSFMGNQIITSIDLTYAHNLTKIGASAFDGCNSIANKVIIPKSVTSIGFAAFYDCSSVPEFDIYANIKKVSEEVFYKCSSLKTVTLREGIEEIGNHAFADCTELEYTNIPNTINYISSSAFQNDPNLTLGVWFGSYGYEYAQSHNIPYVLLDEVKLGDANGDGSVNINDVTTIQRYLAELESLEGIYLHAADANQDGTLDISDATTLQMYLAKYDIPYPIGEVMTQ